VASASSGWIEPDRDDFESAPSRAAIGIAESTTGELNAGGVESELSFILWNLFEPIAGDRLEGTVLLRAIPAPTAPPVNEVTPDGVPGLETPGLLLSLEPREDTETLRRTPYFRTLSAPALALDVDRPTALGDRKDGAPLSTSFCVFSSTAVPDIPMRKLS